MNECLRQRYGIDGSRPVIALAPMAGVTDVPFRTICEGLGADYSVTEMAASAPQLLNSDKNQTRLQFTPNAKVKILQIIGNNAAHMAHAAKLYVEMGADIIDINLGCPAKKINKRGAGSALLSDLSLVETILRKIVIDCPVPVTVKTRLGSDYNNYTLFDIAKIVSDLGIELLTIHGRTRACKFNGEAQFDEIARVKQLFPELTMIANGDIDSIGSAKAVLEKTACDGLMIGRGAIGNPWLFSDIRTHFDSDYSAINIDKKALILSHITETHQYYGDVKGIRFARKHIQAYLDHLRLGEAFKELAKINDGKMQIDLLSDILEDVY